MANFKVAVFFALVVVLLQAASSKSTCQDDCYSESIVCGSFCYDQACANACSNTLSACYENCDLEAKRGFNRPLSRDEPYRNDAVEDEGFYDEFQK